jgi:hypothetical protein
MVSFPQDRLARQPEEFFELEIGVRVTPPLSFTKITARLCLMIARRRFSLRVIVLPTCLATSIPNFNSAMRFFQHRDGSGRIL